METLLMLAMFFVALFLILIVLVQRGKGGGLAGALGGAGGSSAFGAKAGDTFMWFTIYAAVAWILLCIGAAVWSKNGLTDRLGAEDPLLDTVATQALGDEVGNQDVLGDDAAEDESTDAAPAGDAPTESNDAPESETDAG